MNFSASQSSFSWPAKLLNNELTESGYFRSKVSLLMKLSLQSNSKFSTFKNSSSIPDFGTKEKEILRALTRLPYWIVLIIKMLADYSSLSHWVKIGKKNTFCIHTHSFCLAKYRNNYYLYSLQTNNNDSIRICPFKLCLYVLFRVIFLILCSKDLTCDFVFRLLHRQLPC